MIIVRKLGETLWKATCPNGSRAYGRTPEEAYKLAWDLAGSLPTLIFQGMHDDAKI